MKSKLFTLLLLYIYCTIMSAEGQKDFLVIWTKDGDKAFYSLTDKPKITFTATNLVIKANGIEYTYLLDDLSRYTYEQSPSITEINSMVYLDKQIVRPGETSTLSISATLDPIWEGFQMDISLPDGIRAVANEAGDPDVSLCLNRGKNLNVSCDYINGKHNEVHIEIGSQCNYLLNEGFGSLLEMKLATDADYNNEYVITISNIKFINLFSKEIVELKDLKTWAVPTPKDQYQALDYQKGWNWVSQNTENTKSTLTFLSPITDFERLIGATSELVYDEQYGIVGNLTELSPTQGYRLKVGKGLTGVSEKGIWCWPEDYPITLEKGWNWIGYLPYKPLPIEKALVRLKPEEYDCIEGADEFSEYIDGQWQGTLTVMQPGTAYHYHAEARSVFCYPTTLPMTPAEENLIWLLCVPKPNTPWNYDAYRYPDVSSIIASLSIDGQIANEWVVGAFCGDECRGISRRVNNVQYLTIHGSAISKDTIQFKAFNPHTKQMLEIDRKIIFDGSRIGHANAPLLLEAKGMLLEIIDKTIPQQSVSFERDQLVFNNPLTANSTISVYSLNGTLIFKKTVSENGKCSFPLSFLNDGVYVVNVNGLTFKIAKR